MDSIIGLRAQAQGLELRPVPMLTINEIFYSIQGEATRAGEPCVFVRLTACDLRCAWCDTPYAFYEGRKRALEDVVAEVVQHGCRLVEITGGEPLLQDEVYPLMETLVERGYTVMLETGGHRPLTRVPKDVVKIVDVKCPGSGEADKNHWDNLSALSRRDEVKFVVKDRADYEFAREVIDRYELPTRVAAVLVSPVHGVLDPKVLAEWMLADRLPARLQLQLHKLIWSPETRGV
jgi:7-carboxy-7-deazaguanine synthase